MTRLCDGVQCKYLSRTVQAPLAVCQLYYHSLHASSQTERLTLKASTRGCPLRCRSDGATLMDRPNHRSSTDPACPHRSDGALPERTLQHKNGKQPQSPNSMRNPKQKPLDRHKSTKTRSATSDRMPLKMGSKKLAMDLEC
jgi:hypothetical protein